MSSITVRNIPESVKAALVRRAEEQGESLEAFLRRLLQAEATQATVRPDWKDFVASIRARVEALPPAEAGDPDAIGHREEMAPPEGSVGPEGSFGREGSFGKRPPGAP